MRASSIIQVKSLEEAIERVKRTPNIFPNGEAEVEIRKPMDVEDFGDAFAEPGNRESGSSRCQPEARAEGNRLREEIAKRERPERKRSMATLDRER